MADKKISELDEATELDDDDLVVVVEDGETKRMTLDAFRDALGVVGGGGGFVVELNVFADDESVVTGNGKRRYFIPDVMDGLDLISVAAAVSTVSSSGTPTIMVRNVTQAADMLTTAITIDANEKTSYSATTPAAIDTSNDDVAEGDEIAIDVDVAGTGTRGLYVILRFG